MPSSFADRLWWARHNAGLGATKLTRQVGCAQSLVSHIENQNAEKSHFNNQFAKVLNVDPTWLAYGNPERAPEGFDEEVARKRVSGTRPNPVSMPKGRQPGVLQPEPRWAVDSVAEPLAPLTGADAMMKGLVTQFMDFVRLAGAERARALLTTLDHVAGLITHESVIGHDKIANSHERDNGSKK